ncbi:MliC family protein [Pseudomonas sp. TE3786]
MALLSPWLAICAQAASFDCSKAAAGSIEERVCKTPALSAQDEQLAKVYKQALSKAKNEHPPTLKAEQRGWIKGRDECWKDDDKTRCVADAYQQRIAELQARYQLLPGMGPVRFICDNLPTKEVLATFYATQPPTLIAEFGDSTSLMYAESTASGSKYQGRNESFREHQGEATVVWGYEAVPMQCKRQ